MNELENIAPLVGMTEWLLPHKRYVLETNVGLCLLVGVFFFHKRAAHDYSFLSRRSIGSCHRIGD